MKYGTSNVKNSKNYFHIYYNRALYYYKYVVGMKQPQCKVLPTYLHLFTYVSILFRNVSAYLPSYTHKIVSTSPDVRLRHVAWRLLGNSVPYSQNVAISDSVARRKSTRKTGYKQMRVSVERHESQYFSLLHYSGGYLVLRNLNLILFFLMYKSAGVMLKFYV